MYERHNSRPDFRGGRMSDLIGEAEIPFLRTGIDFTNMNGVDVGCGGRKIDPCTIGIDVARNIKTDLSCSNITEANWVGDGMNLPFEDESLDYVISRHTLEHLVDWKKALLEWIRALKHGGILSIIVPNPDCKHHSGHGIDVEEVYNFLKLLVKLDHIQYIPFEGEVYSWGLRGRK